MTFRDLVVISMGNLWRMKLRTFLTTSGVLIAIAAFVAMLSFGAGNQERINEEFNKLGLFSTMQVYPKNRGNVADTASAAKLDQAALLSFTRIPGVRLVYPYDAFSATVRLGDSVIATKAQALPVCGNSDEAIFRPRRRESLRYPGQPTGDDLEGVDAESRNDFAGLHCRSETDSFCPRIGHRQRACPHPIRWRRDDRGPSQENSSRFVDVQGLTHDDSPQ